MSGDLNTVVDEVLSTILAMDDKLQFIHTKETMYNTENRLQKRNRDGWSGVQVI